MKSAKFNFSHLLKWLFILLSIGIAVGSASAFFLVALQYVTETRENHLWIIGLLPLGGLLIGFLYHYFGQEVVKGNNLILEEYDRPKTIIPLKMAPLVLIGTLITHLFGGSAGREGTAVQMGSAIADQFTRYFKLDIASRKTLLILGISAGFASIFGTPIAAAVFALEVLYFSKINLKTILPSVLVAFISFYTVEFWQVKHTLYVIPEIPEVTFNRLFWCAGCGVLFGIAALLFSRITRFFGHLFSKISYAPLRPFLGGLILVVTIFSLGTTKFIGLGIPTLVDSFENQQPAFYFFLKILFTAVTIGSGFKGGEVTPLFFVGATLGSAISIFVPLPVALLAGMGFVAVFSGATHTPIACTIMGMELFGYECGIYVGIVCLVAYFSSGAVGIYSSQIVKGPKIQFYQKFRRKNLDNL